MSDEKDNIPLYNSRIVDNYIKLIKAKYSYIDVEDLLKFARMETYQVKDEAHWFTQNHINRFHERLKEVTGNRDIAREAGRYAASPDALGIMRRYVLGLIGPQNAYELIGNYASKFTKSTTVKAFNRGPDKVEIVVTPNEGVKEEPYQCENRLGFFDAISTLFNYKLPQIEHPECTFLGGEACKYIVTWDKPLSYYWKKVRLISTFVLFVICTLSTLTLPLLNTVIVFGSSAILLLLITLYINKLDNTDLKNAVGVLQQSSDELTRQVSLNYENALLVNEVSQALSKELELNNILNNVINILQKRLDYDRGLILLANPDKTRLVTKAGFGYKPNELSRFMMSSGFHLDRKESKGVFILCFNLQRPYLVNDLSEIEESLTRRSLDFAKRMGVKSFICCPIIYEDESLGVLAVDNIKTKTPLLQRDINILMGIAHQIGISIHNAKLIDARFKQFQSILQVLAATTDARDPITAGHSEQVTEYAVGICSELELSQSYTEMIRVASLLHDYGKIGVDDSILKKPGRLSQDEYEQIKTHASKTRNILEQINFEGIYREVPEIAGAHHEKLDGTGYPLGLTSERIHFGAKIIAVADVFEALTSRRHYRDPMPINEAFDNLIESVGTHFDKDCVEALIGYYNSNASIPYLYNNPFKSTLENIKQQSEPIW
ncbi:HD-GYP domain-containing protein [Thermodesulfobacteriota bacterium]